MNVKIINQSTNPLPAYATEGSSGMDIRAYINETVTLQPLERALIPTGLFIELPTGYEAQIRPRSGLAIKQGLTCLNSPGTIDADYRGEVKIILINLSQEPQTIHPGDRIAQMVVHEVERRNLNHADNRHVEFTRDEFHHGKRQPPLRVRLRPDLTLCEVKERHHGRTLAARRIAGDDLLCLFGIFSRPGEIAPTRAEFRRIGLQMTISHFASGHA